MIKYSLFCQGVQNIGLNKILEIWKLMEGADKHPKSETNGPINTASYSPLFLKNWHFHMVANFTLLPGFKDHLIRSFAKVEHNPFCALKKYATQTEDRDLEAKLSIVETYRCRIPELVTRLERLYEEVLSKAGMHTRNVHSCCVSPDSCSETPSKSEKKVITDLRKQNSTKLRLHNESIYKGNHNIPIEEWRLFKR